MPKKQFGNHGFNSYMEMAEMFQAIKDIRKMKLSPEELERVKVLAELVDKAKDAWNNVGSKVLHEETFGMFLAKVILNVTKNGKPKGGENNG